MNSSQVEIRNLHYNAAEQAFDANVVLHGSRESLNFPCRIEAPLTASFEIIARRMEIEARARASSGAPGMVSRVPARMALADFFNGRFGWPDLVPGFFSGNRAA